MKRGKRNDASGYGRIRTPAEKEGKGSKWEEERPKERGMGGINYLPASQKVRRA